MQRIVASFTAPGARVVLVTADAPIGAVTEEAPVSTGVAEDGITGLADTPNRRRELDAARGAVEGIGRKTYCVDYFASAGVGSAMGANFADDPTADGTRSRRVADLVIASVASDNPPDARFGVACAALLRRGGILAVITHSDWSTGRLVDPTGAVVAVCQNADLLYLQHIVALHAGIRRGRLTSPAGHQHRRLRRVRSAAALAPHERAHSDVLIFTQVHDDHGDRHPSAEPVCDASDSARFRSPAAAAFDGGVIQ